MTNSLTRNNNNCCTKTNSTFSGILKGFSLLLFVAISSFGMNAQDQWYIPDTAVEALGSGPAMILASTSPGPNYILADQECAQARYDSDAWCVDISWDIICLNAYNECLDQTPDQGCMDESACNYDPAAQIDDDSCILPDGCTNDSALNFSASALCDDGSCVFCEPSLAIACPADTDVACGESTDAAFTGEATTETSDCTDEVELTFTDSLTDNNEGCPFITRTWTATAGDLSDSCDQIITLTDSEDPIFTSVIEDFSATCEEAFSYDSCREYFEANIALPSFEDNCTLNEDLGVNVTYDFNGGFECPTIEACTRTVTITDQCGNSASQETTISVTDEVAPVFVSFPNDISVECADYDFDNLDMFNFGVGFYQEVSFEGLPEFQGGDEYFTPAYILIQGLLDQVVAEDNCADFIEYDVEFDLA